MSKDKDATGPEKYTVGYGKPPKQTRFKKGQSGNPTGRRKGSLNLATVLSATLNEKVVVTERGKKKRITKLAVIVKQLVNKAAAGDLRAVSQVAELKLKMEQNAEREPDSGKVLNELDKKTILSILKEYGSKKD
jgi:Family of unknown function (DUF5681)